MSKLIMTRGLPGSGKSTWAAEQEGFVVVTKDDIRKELEATGWVWSRKNEKAVKNLQAKRILEALDAKKDVIAADTNFGDHEGRLKNIAKQAGADFAVRDFTEIPLETCLERNEIRVGTPAYVPPGVIRDMWTKYILPNVKVEPVVQDKNHPWAIICDLDGTLAIHNGRSPYDTGKCGTDIVNYPVHTILKTFHGQGVRVIFVSGRENKFREETQKWLNETDERFAGCQLLMRPTGDTRNDAIVKNEIYDEHIRDNFYVLFVLDDRDRVVKRWRALGLTCLQVAEGNF